MYFTPPKCVFSNNLYTFWNSYIILIPALWLDFESDLTFLFSYWQTYQLSNRIDFIVIKFVLDFLLLLACVKWFHLEMSVFAQFFFSTRDAHNIYFMSSFLREKKTFLLSKSKSLIIDAKSTFVQTHLSQRVIFLRAIVLNNIYFSRRLFFVNIRNIFFLSCVYFYFDSKHWMLKFSFRAN